MSIIDPIERYIKRYDYLINKRENLEKEHKKLSKEEERELEKIQPNVITPIILLFEILNDTISECISNTKSKHHTKQTGGEAGEAVVMQPNLEQQEPQEEPDQVSREEVEKYIVDIHELLTPLVAQLIATIEKKKKGLGEDKTKYPDVGTAIVNSFTIALRKIKDFFSGESDDAANGIFDKVDPKKMIPGFPENPEEAKKVIQELEKGIEEPLVHFKNTISRNVGDIADSSVSGILNAISLVPGIGTTLQLWRLLQNVIVIMSKTTGILSSGKTNALKGKEALHRVAQKVADNAEASVVNAATNVVDNTVNNALGSSGGTPLVAAPLAPAPLAPAPLATLIGAPNATPLPAPAATPAATLSPETEAQIARLEKWKADNLRAAATPAAPETKHGGSADYTGGAKKPTTKKLWTTKKYKKEYDKSVRELKRTKKRFMNYMRKII